MSKYIDADRLKTEVEKHIKDIKDAGKRLTPDMGFFDAKLSGIYDVMAIIDSLQQEEEHEVDLDKEIDLYREKEFGESWDGCMPVGCLELDIMARHFFELGQKDAADKLDEIEYNRQRTEEEMLDNGLDEAADEYAYSVYPSEGVANIEICDAFKRGAEWKKEQMMKESEEGMVKYHDYPEYKYVLVPYEEFNDGDKVRIIIVKEEEDK